MGLLGDMGIGRNSVCHETLSTEPVKLGTNNTGQALLLSLQKCVIGQTVIVPIATELGQSS